MTFYLPIAEIEINLLVILFFGFVVGFMSGLFGVGGGFFDDATFNIYGNTSVNCSWN